MQFSQPAPADTIVFASGLTGTITLTSRFLEINKDLTITGPEPANLAVSGNNSSPVFQVEVNKYWRHSRNGSQLSRDRESDALPIKEGKSCKLKKPLSCLSEEAGSQS